MVRYMPSPIKFLASLGMAASLLVVAPRPTTAAPDDSPRQSRDGGQRPSPDHGQRPSRDVGPRQPPEGASRQSHDFGPRPSPEGASRQLRDVAPRQPPEGASRHSRDDGPRLPRDGASRHSGDLAQDGNAARPAQGRRGERGHHDGRAHHDGRGHHDGRTQHNPHRWYDNAHGHGHSYPAHGWTVRSLPPRSRLHLWAGVNYGFFDGIWYSPGLHGYVVVRPPLGIIVSDLPAFRTVVMIGGLAYLYANGVYYRERAEGNYEVVSAPADTDPAAMVTTSAARAIVYPRLNQSAEQQASDEYECHRWAATQSSFDPTLAATSSVGADPSRRGDYQRARMACLDGRNYTVR